MHVNIYILIFYKRRFPLQLTGGSKGIEIGHADLVA